MVRRTELKFCARCGSAYQLANGDPDYQHVEIEVGDYDLATNTYPRTIKDRSCYCHRCAAIEVAADRADEKDDEGRPEGHEGHYYQDDVDYLLEHRDELIKDWTARQDRIVEVIKL